MRDFNPCCIKCRLVPIGQRSVQPGTQVDTQTEGNVLTGPAESFENEQRARFVQTVKLFSATDIRVSLTVAISWWLGTRAISIRRNWKW